MKLAKDLEVGDYIWTPDGWLPITQIYYSEHRLRRYGAGGHVITRHANEPVPTGDIPA